MLQSLLVVAAVGSLLLVNQPSLAQTLSTLHSFNGTDGALPSAGLLFDTQGNLYGTTSGGGDVGAATVFELTPAGKFNVLYTFSKGADGDFPTSSRVVDADGNVYGTTAGGGIKIGFFCRLGGCGTVFKVTPAGTETVLHSFNFTRPRVTQPPPYGVPDGAWPYSRLIRDTQGNLYGTDSRGGSFACDTFAGCGTVFKLTPSGSETVLYTFSGSPKDGAEPYGGLVMDAQGNFYGTTTAGGAYGNGTVYELTPTGTETVLYSFRGPPDGAVPYGDLVFDTHGNLYGTTYVGGTGNCFNGLGCGTAFVLAPTDVETVLHSFAGADGVQPESGLVLDTQGNLYGTTSIGGANGLGTVYRLSQSGGLTTIYSFTGGIDGAVPHGGVIFDAVGNLYGSTLGGGAYNLGAVFKLAP